MANKSNVRGVSKEQREVEKIAEQVQNSWKMRGRKTDEKKELGWGGRL